TRVWATRDPQARAEPRPIQLNGSGRRGKIVGDVEIARTRVLGPDAKTDIFKAAVLDRKTDRSEDFFLAGEDGDVGVSESEAIEDVIAGSHHVEEPMVAIAVDHDLAIAGGL